MPSTPPWSKLIAALAEGLALPTPDIERRLAPLVGPPGDEAAELLADPSAAPDEDLRACFEDAGIPRARLNRAIRRFRLAASGGAQPGAAPQAAALLPAAPDDEGLLASLVVGGIAKVSETDVAAALRVLLAERLGIFGIQEQLARKIEEHAVRLGEPCGPVFYRIQRELARQRHADVLTALGASKNLVSPSRKRALLDRLDPLVGHFAAYQRELTTWKDQWMERISNPGALFAGLAALMGGGSAAPAVASSSALMEAPDAGPVQAATATLIDRVNQVFAGTGIPVARALAADAIALKRLLEDADLPGALGASGREEMLKRLGIAVTAQGAQLERDLTRYVLAALRLPKVSTDQLPAYIVAVEQLGDQIDWAALSPAASGGRRKTF